MEDETEGNQRLPQDLADQLRPARHYRGSLKKVLQDVEQQYIQQVLTECGGRMSEAARKLGIHRSMLYRTRYGLAVDKMLQSCQEAKNSESTALL